jgi:hypothetical protein
MAWLKRVRGSILAIKHYFLRQTTKAIYLNKDFFDENVMALKLDSSEQFAFFVNETKYDKDLNNIDDVITFSVD